MAYCYYTCSLLPLDLAVRNGFSPRWLGNHLRDPNAPMRREALSIHPMTCPFVTKLVAAADELFGAGGNPSPGDCLVVPGGCDAARRMGDLLAATYPERVFVLPTPRSANADTIKTVADDLGRLEHWLVTRSPDATSDAAPLAVEQEPPAVDYPEAPVPGGVFVVAGPLSDNSLLRLVVELGVPVAGLESCTSPDRWRPLAAGAVPDAAGPGYKELAARLLDAGMCPRRSTAARRDYLERRLDETQPSSIIYARQSFCDPGAYDSLLVAQLAGERALPYLEIEVDFPFDANGPLRTRVEAFLEAQLLDEDLLQDHRDTDKPSAKTTVGGAVGDDLLSDDLFDEED